MGTIPTGTLTAAQRLVASPAEGYNVELKSWIDPTLPAGQAKIVKATMALYNRNGGHLLIGFEDATGKPVPGAPYDPRAVFDLDEIQKLISRHSCRLFDISLEFVERDGQAHPVFGIPSGVRTPTAVRKPLVDGGKELLRVGEVPFRTLHSNGTFSSASAGPEDWADLVEICFDNREADFGRFARRQLSGVDLSGLLSALRGAAAPSFSVAQSLVSEELLDFGNDRYLRTRIERGIPAEQEKVLQWGTWEVAAVLDPPIKGGAATQTFRDKLLRSNPQYTPWPSWPETAAFRGDFSRGRFTHSGWEALIISVGASSVLPWDFFTFMRLDPTGKFYQLRALDDDAMARARGGNAKVVFDPGLMVQQVAEAMIVAINFAKALGAQEQTARIEFAFRWQGLRDRGLLPWSSHVRIDPGYRATDDQDASTVLVPLYTAETALGPYVEHAVKSVFARFGGFEMPRAVIEQLIGNLTSRRS